MLIPVLIGGVLLFAVVLIAVGMRNPQADSINERLNQFTERPLSLAELELQQPFSQRVLVPLMRAVLTKLGQFSPKQAAEKARLNLQQAGNPGNISPAVFSGIRLVLALVLFALIGLVTFTSMPFQQALMYTGIGAMLGYLLPSIWLGQQIKKRKHNIVRALPDALDLLTISVEAGLAFDSAMQRVTEKWDNELSREFKRVLNDTRLGRSSREALKDMGARCGVDDVQTFLAAVIQAQQLGVSIGKILRIQSDQMRIRRRQRAEEQAQKAPIKMLFPMVFLIFPSLFVVILGPAIPRLMTSLGNL